LLIRGSDYAQTEIKTTCAAASQEITEIHTLPTKRAGFRGDASGAAGLTIFHKFNFGLQVNQMLRKRKGDKDYFYPLEELRGFWLGLPGHVAS